MPSALARPTPLPGLDAAGPAPDRRDDLAIHVFTVSATLVGVCLTVVGLLRHLAAEHPFTTLADDLLTGDAFLLLVACATAYTALRTADRARRARRERWADALFLTALAVMTAACVMVTYLLA
jgi:predicted permease